MAIQSRNTIKNWFKRSLKPLEGQFADWIDSFYHRTDTDIPIASVAGLQAALDAIPGLISDAVADATTPLDAFRFRGNWNGATNAFPIAGGTGAAGAIAKGNAFLNTAETTTLLGSDGGTIPAGAIIFALVDAPSSVANWKVFY